MNRRVILIVIVLAIVSVFCVLPHVARAQRAADPGWLLPVPEVDADPKIPTLEAVVGHGWARDVSSPAQIERYVRALAAAAPGRTRLVQYGSTFEGRPLYYLVITSPQNMQRLEEIRADNLRLADPRWTPAAEAKKIIEQAPAFVWLAYSIHGNETSSSDAAMLTAYHLLADRRPATRRLLERLVVFIDPLQNADGRQRFVNAYREWRGAEPDANPAAAEHTERWISGRSNHYLFDMNRDWFLQSQQETRGKVAAYLRWQPHIYVDAHEMGRNSTYFFNPSAEPSNEMILPRQVEWYDRLGRSQAGWFDRYGFAFTTREMFDSFYPGYGSEWPTLHGALGILWEEASVMGLVVDRDDETKLHFHDAVRHHYVSGLATVSFAAEHRAGMVENFYRARVASIELGRTGPVRDFFLLRERKPHRADRLARLLIRNGVDVRRLRGPLEAKATNIRDGAAAPRTIPAGSFHIPVAQPAARLVRILLDRHYDMGKAFVDRQLDRLARRLGDEIYDVTAWSLPLAFDVECLAVPESLEIDSQPIDEPRLRGRVTGGRAKLAYLVPPHSDGAMLALGRWLRQGLRVHVNDQAFTLGGTTFAKGTLILRVHENPETLHDAVRQAANTFGLRIHATDTGYVDEGSHLGGPHVHWVRPPRVAMLIDRPTGYAAGHTWYLFDQVLRYPVTRVAGRNLGRLDLAKFDVLILPDGRYSDGDAPSESQLARLKQWARDGGTLILVKGAARWACGEKVGLLATEVETKPVPGAATASAPASQPASAPATKKSKEKDDDTEPPTSLPGAFLRADVYNDHWVTFGYGATVDVLFNGNLILTPLKPNKGRNLVTFVHGDGLVTSGFGWRDTLKQIAGKPYVLYQSLGRGHVVAFTDDPNFRAMYPAVQRLFINAVFFGPGH